MYVGCYNRRDLKTKNNVIFKSARINHLEIYTMTQLKVWSWIILIKHLTYFTYFDWCIDPMACLKYLIKQ